MDFSLSPELKELQQRTRDFIAQEVVSMEKEDRKSVV